MKILLISLLFLSINSYADEIPKERRLKKLSMHLRGIPPKRQEYADLKSTSEQNIESFFSDKTTEYLKSEDHVQKMNIRLAQLFRLKLPTEDFNYNYYREENNALNSLFMDIARYNLSWDKLLTGKSYKLHATSDNFFQTDFNFLGAVTPRLFNYKNTNGILNTLNQPLTNNPEVYDENGNLTQSESGQTIVKEYEFAPGDNRIAGAITTQRFFGRYTNTALNKNRRRAAAIFRIFLCDDMEAAITSNEENTDTILNFVFPNKANDSNSPLIGESAHGERADCMSCHYKLDPLGKTFGGSGNALAPMSFKGNLVYKSKSGKDISIPVNGLGEMAQALVEQEDYKSCQTKHFWDWFIGKDRELTEETQAELIAKYESLGGKANDFIHYLVNRPEFYEKANLQTGAHNE